MRRSRESGQAVILVVVAMGLFLIGAVALAIDGAQLYAQRQMAQTAADAAAQAGIMSIFDNTNATGPAAFSASAFTCTTSDARTPCVYAARNGFGTSSDDTINVTFPTSAPGVTLSSTSPVNLIKVEVARSVPTGLMRLLGPTAATVKAYATAAIVQVISPVPIIVTHPSLSGALSSNGGPTITICGGPSRSIQVNSSSSTSFAMSSNTIVDLSKAGPLDNGTCSTGTGADFGDWGGPSASTFDLRLGTTGHFLQPASPIEDPFATVAAPTRPATAPDASPTDPRGSGAVLNDGVSGCPAAPAKSCRLYSPGAYPAGIIVKNQTAVFKPGLYYMDTNGFKNESNGLMIMSTGFADSTETGGQGMVVYNASNATFDVGSNSSATLVGSTNASTYKSILFFNNRAATANTGVGGSDQHKFGGGGNVSLTGSIYITNSVSVMRATPGQYQTVLLQGNPGSSTLIRGEIVVSALSLGGTAGITMNLDASLGLVVRQVALVQ